MRKQKPRREGLRQENEPQAQTGRLTCDEQVRGSVSMRKASNPNQTEMPDAVAAKSNQAKERETARLTIATRIDYRIKVQKVLLSRERKQTLGRMSKKQRSRGKTPVMRQGEQKNLNGNTPTCLSEICCECLGFLPSWLWQWGR